MKLVNILRSLSFLRSSATRSSTVVPLSEQSSFKRLNLSFNERRAHVTATDLLDNVAELVTAQKAVSSAVSDPNNSGKYDKESIDEYLEDGVELLDVCNFLVARIESVRRYGESVKRAVHLVRPGMGPAGFARVKELLDVKKYCEDDVSVERCWSRLKRLVGREKRRRQGEGEGSLTRSLTDAVDDCRRLETALSLKRGRRSCGGGCTGQMVELRDLVELAKKLRDPTAEVDGEYVREKCDGVVDAVGPLEEKVKELYKQLVRTRMALLGIMSYH